MRYGKKMFGCVFIWLLVLFTFTCTIYADSPYDPYYDGSSLYDPYYERPPADEVDTPKENLKSVDKIKELNEALSGVFIGSGVILLVYGCGSLVLSFQSESVETKVRAASVIVVAIMLILFNDVVGNLFGI